MLLISVISGAMMNLMNPVNFRVIQTWIHGLCVIDALGDLYSKILLNDFVITNWKEFSLKYSSYC